MRDTAEIVDRIAPTILICLLGGFQVLKKGRIVKFRGNGKAEALLSILALHTTVSRDVLLDALWHHNETRQATQSLYSLVYSLHKLLGDAIGGLAPITRKAEYYALNRSAGVYVDIELFDSLASQSDKHTSAGNLGEGIASCIHALHLYRGDLDGASDASAVIERERLRTSYLKLLARLTDFHYATGDYTACADCASRLLKSDPCYEEAHRVLMRCHVKQGARSLALRQYHVCRDILRAELDLSPEVATHTLYLQIRSEAVGA